MLSRDSLILLDLKGAALHPDVITAVNGHVDKLGLFGNVALYTLPESVDMSKEWRGEFICGYKARHGQSLSRYFQIKESET